MPSSSQRKEYHRILNVSSEATTDEIRAAYKKLALIWHPDRHHSATEKEDAEAKFIEINRAYRALTEKKERRRHRKPPDEPERKASGSSSPPASPQYSSHSSAFRSDRGGSSSEPGLDTDTQTTPPSSPPELPEPSLPSPSSTPRATSTHLPESPAQSPKAESWTPPWSPIPAIKSFFPSGFRGGPISGRQRNPTSRLSHKSTTQSSTDRPPTSPFREESPQEASRTAHPDPFRLRKQSKKGGLHRNYIPSDSNENKRALPKKTHVKQHMPRERGNRAKINRSPSPEFRHFPPSRNTPKEWKYHLQLTLEELFRGTEFKFRITRYLHSNSRKKEVSINVSIPPGCSEGNEIRCVGAGNYCKDGTLQDVIFVIEEIPHNQFTRAKDDLVMDVKIPWVDSLDEETGEIMVEGIDGEELWVSIPYRLDKELEGEQFIMGGGMPIRIDGRIIRRGDLIVRWEIVLDTESSFTSGWRNLKKLFHR